MNKIAIYAVIFSLLGGLLPALPVKADETLVPGGGDLNYFVCSTLYSLGLGCGNGASSNYYPGTTGSGNLLGSGNTANNSSENNSSGNNSALVASIYVAGQKQEGSDSVNLVRVKSRSEIYEIVGGKKHLIPTMDIFFDYGFKLEWVQDITQYQLDKFLRVKLMQITGDKKKTYYFTEGGMIRLVLDENVFNSYGDREEDVIVISKKEFNYYPQNQYVYQESPLNRDVFQLTGSGKRYLTPMAVARMRITSDQIAPINQTELDSYKILAPVVR